MHVNESIEVLKENVIGLQELYLSVQGHRLNDVMKVLTIIATIFIPLTFIAGIYGMNFRYMPELDKRWAYGEFWAVVIVLVAVQLAVFRRWGWIGKKPRR